MDAHLTFIERLTMIIAPVIVCFCVNAGRIKTARPQKTWRAFLLPPARQKSLPPSSVEADEKKK